MERERGGDYGTVYYRERDSPAVCIFKESFLFFGERPGCEIYPYMEIPIDSFDLF